MSGIIEGVLPPAMFTIGYALFVACFFCRDMLYLRALAVVGQIALIPYYIDPSGQFDWGPYVWMACTAILVCEPFLPMRPVGRKATRPADPGGTVDVRRCIFLTTAQGLQGHIQIRVYNET